MPALATGWPADVRVLHHHHNVVQIDDFLAVEEADALLVAGRGRLGLDGGDSAALGEQARQDAFAQSLDAAAMDDPAVDTVRKRIAQALRLADKSTITFQFVEDPTPASSERATERLEYRYTHALHDGPTGHLEEGLHAPVFSFAIFLTGQQLCTRASTPIAVSLGCGCAHPCAWTLDCRGLCRRTPVVSVPPQWRYQFRGHWCADQWVTVGTFAVLPPWRL